MSRKKIQDFFADLELGRVASVRCFQSLRMEPRLSVTLKDESTYTIFSFPLACLRLQELCGQHGVALSFHIAFKDRCLDWVLKPALWGAMRWTAMITLGLFLSATYTFISCFFTLSCLSTLQKVNHTSNELTTVSEFKKAREASEAERQDWDDLILPEETLKELQNFVDVSNSQDPCEKMGARPKKGVLFAGPPGTGKTLAASILAQKTHQNFIAFSGSELMESRWVGSGAKKIRALFQDLKANQPCIVFIDEFDALGGKRHSEIENGSNSETLNELLHQLDGFHEHQGITIIAATNDPQSLDPALVRPGRFNGTIHFFNPNLESRLKLLKLFASRQKISYEPLIDFTRLAACSSGFSGASIENWVNEAGLLAMRRMDHQITLKDFEQTFFRQVLGSRSQQDEAEAEHSLRMIAYHEAGHLLLAWLLSADTRKSNINYCSIVPGAQSFAGITVFDLGDETSVFEREPDLYKNSICISFGGRCGEQRLRACEGKNFGASGDFSNALEMARKAIFSRRDPTSLMPEIAYFSTKNLQKFYSSQLFDQTQKTLNQLLREQEQRAHALLELNGETHQALAELLMEKKSIFYQEIRDFFESRNCYLSSKKLLQKDGLQEEALPSLLKSL